MLNVIVKFIAEHEKLRYIFRCIRRCGDSNFIYNVNHMYDSPLIIVSQSRGEENKGRIICEIKLSNEEVGFFAAFNYILENLYYTYTMNMSPIVVIGSKFPYFEKDGINGINNPWEYYFEQYESLTQYDLLNSFRVSCIDDRNIDQLFKSDEKNGYRISEIYIEKLSTAMRKYVKLKPEISKKIYSDIFNLLKNEKTLGVQIRMGGMLIGCNQHPVVPTLEEYLREIEVAIEKGKFSKVFLATDDKRALNAVISKFGNMVIYFDDVTRVELSLSPYDINKDEDKHNFLCGLEVLRDMYTLAECDGLVAGLSQVSLAAQITKKSFNKKYSYHKIIDKGINENNLLANGNSVKEIVEKEQLKYKNFSNK